MDSQLLLNGMLPPSEKSLSIKANENLSVDEKGSLYHIVEDCQQQGKSFNVDAAFDTIAVLFGSYFKRGKTLPFLLKQVIFCLTVHCLEYNKMNQKGVIDSLNAKGVSISHNFFSREEHTPGKYLLMSRYKAPKSVISYMGAKKNGLGIAIKNLTYQAGKYDVFCDIFGGSGAASLAVNKVHKVDYIYNELNASVFNLIYVVADDELHLKLIDDLHILQEYIKNGGEPYGKINLDKVTKEFEKKYKNQIDKDIISTGFKEFKTCGYPAVKLAYDVYKDIVEKSSGYSVNLNKVKYTKRDLLALFDIPAGANQDLIDIKIVAASIHHCRLFEEYNKKKLKQKELIWESESKQNLKGTELNLKYKRSRAYSYYIYFFEKVLNNSKGILNNRIEHAVAEVFRHYFAYNNRVESSSVLSNLRTSISAIDEFAKEDFKKLITAMHESLKGTTLKNEDCSCIIKECNSLKDIILKNRDCSDILKEGNKLKDVLFYADPPYIATTDYKDENNNVGSFTGDNMKKLIYDLINSGHKFIFSCRAVKTKSKGVIDLNKFREGNKEILNNVYNVFRGHNLDGNKRKFYVLALENESTYEIDGEPVGTLISKLKNSGVLEIMITNFKISSFVDKGCNDISYKVYPFDKFLKLFMNYALLPKEVFK